MRVLAILSRYPQLSETYISTELRTLWPKHDVSIIGLGSPDLPQANHFPYQTIGRHDAARLIEAARGVAPQVLHTHYLFQAPRMHRVAEALGVPYTIRTHSYDILRASPSSLRTWSDLVNDERCLGILVFPFLKARLVEAGMAPSKVHECFPVVDFDRFYNRAPNTPGVMNVGAALPKKNMEGYLRLATQIRGLPTRLYAIGYDVARLRELNDELGRPVMICDTVDPEDMPGEYKRHTWLIYSASRSAGTVGWPMAVAEAQAAGVGLCIEGIRPDLRDLVGPGGFLLGRLSDALDIIDEPVPAAVREAGFEQARRSDVRAHIRVLEALWR